MHPGLPGTILIYRGMLFDIPVCFFVFLAVKQIAKHQILLELADLCILVNINCLDAHGICPVAHLLWR